MVKSRQGNSPELHVSSTINLLFQRRKSTCKTRKENTSVVLATKPPMFKSVFSKKTQNKLEMEENNLPQTSMLLFIMEVRSFFYSFWMWNLLPFLFENQILRIGFGPPGMFQNRGLIWIDHSRAIYQARPQFGFDLGQ